jgi:hypothetical protein
LQTPARRTRSEAPTAAFPIRKHAIAGKSILLKRLFISKRDRNKPGVVLAIQFITLKLELQDRSVRQRERQD